MNGELKPSEQWLCTEDQGCFDERVARLEWLASKATQQQQWLFFGGWLNQQLLEEARYCFVYGQFLSSAILGFAFIDRTLAAMFYASGRNDLERATSKRLFQEANKSVFQNPQSKGRGGRARSTKWAIHQPDISSFLLAARTP
jgi:hypothetical protein